MFLQTLITGIAIGGIYALMAVGYSLVFSILNFSNFAHGVVIMLGAYIGYYMCAWFGAPVLVSMVGAMLGTAIIAVVVEKLAYRPLRLKRAVPLYFMISAMGAAIFLENLIYVTVGAHFFNYPEFLQRSVQIGRSQRWPAGYRRLVPLCGCDHAVDGVSRQGEVRGSHTGRRAGHDGFGHAGSQYRHAVGGGFLHRRPICGHGGRVSGY